MDNKKPWDEDYSAAAPQSTPSNTLPWEENYNTPQNVPQKSFGQNALETTEDLTKAIGKGASFGFSDELAGAANVGVDTLAGLANKINPNWGYEDTNDIKGSYLEGRDAARRDAEMSAARSPIANTVGEIGGAVATGVATGGGALKALSPLAKLGSAAPAIGVGTVEGGLFGAGQSEAETVKGLAEDTAKGAALGGATAGLLQGAGGVYNKYFKKGANDLAENMAAKGSTEMLNATPNEVAKLKAKGVYNDIPSYLRSKGFKGNTEDLSRTLKESTDEAGKKIGSIADNYDGFMDAVKKDVEYYDKFKNPKVQNNPNALMIKDAADKLQKNAYNFNAVADDLEKEVLNKIKGVPNLENQVADVESYIAKLRKLGTVDSLSELNRQRRGIDSLINYDKLNQKATVMDEVYSTVRKDINNHIKDNMLPNLDSIIAGYQKNINKPIKEGMVDMAKSLTDANKEYTMASNVKDILKRAGGRSKSAITKTDLGLTSLSGMASLMSGNPLPMAVPLLNKAASIAAPKLRYAAPSILQGAENIGGALQKVTTPLVPGAIQQITKPEEVSKPWESQYTPKTPQAAAQGTKYESILSNPDPQKNAVNHKVLMAQDPEYRKKFLGKEDNNGEE